MPDPFAAALGALFRAPGSAAALFTPAGGVPQQIRIVIEQPDEDKVIGRGRVVEGSLSIGIQRSDVPQPAKGDLVELTDTAIGGVTKLKLYGQPRLDAQGLSWTCGAVAA